MVKIAYLVHDLSDATVRKRVRMLRAGGAEVRVAGFRRTSASVTEMDGVPLIDLGQTHDGSFVHRMASVSKILATGLRRRLGGFRPDVVVARNLEMLILAVSLRNGPGPKPRIVYETLDIHRLLLGTGAASRGMRALERALLSRVSLVLTSSPAFIDQYLKPVQKLAAPVLLLENKVLRLDAPSSATPAASGSNGDEPASPGRPDGATVRRRREGPIVIGWFGALRCARSLDLLSRFSRAANGRYEIVLRGRPAYREFDDFHALVDAEPHLRFEGPYRSPEDLPGIYGDVDLVWAIDFFEEGLNSRWLLPNRLYEGCLHGGVPIAMAGTQTARFIEEKGIGAVLERDSVEALASLLDGADLEAMRSAVQSLDPKRLASGPEECRALVASLSGSTTTRPAPMGEHA